MFIVKIIKLLTPIMVFLKVRDGNRNCKFKNYGFIFLKKIKSIFQLNLELTYRDIVISKITNLLDLQFVEKLEI